ncbi:hypothetical protein LNKW23_05270 [Paralimibaculum aggregatum]|uniref:Uncharacterized protein n=1 Tax=Paralimibaculum aggregatum TaxID=3036245 RepID=A0ABQ6LKX8_9RHOB|nr:hypothetical protein LNKW23_05270 [Limibaculum sp. NKW23]
MWVTGAPLAAAIWPGPMFGEHGQRGSSECGLAALNEGDDGCGGSGSTAARGVANGGNAPVAVGRAIDTSNDGAVWPRPVSGHHLRRDPGAHLGGTGWGDG